MRAELLTTADIEYSRDIFTDPANYGPFNRDPDGLMTVGCIDPRQTDQPCIPIIMQTSGGEGGLALDDALVDTAVARDRGESSLDHITTGFMRLAAIRAAYGYRGFDLEVGDEYMQAPSGLYQPQVHSNGCRLLGSVGRVYGELATPTDFTRGTLQTLWKRYELTRFGISETTLKQLSDAAKLRLEEAEKIDGDTLLHTATNENRPDPAIVVDTPGPNRAAFYILNHTTDLGLNRQRIHRDLQQPIRAQAFHATPLAVIEHVLSPIREPKEQKALRIAALVARTAVVRGVLTDYGTAPLTFLDVSRTRDGEVAVTVDQADPSVSWGLSE